MTNIIKQSAEVIIDKIREQNSTYEERPALYVEDIYTIKEKEVKTEEPKRVIIIDL